MLVSLYSRPQAYFGLVISSVLWLRLQAQGKTSAFFVYGLLTSQKGCFWKDSRAVVVVCFSDDFCFCNGEKRLLKLALSRHLSGTPVLLKML